MCCNNETNNVINTARCFETVQMVDEWFECRHRQCFIHVMEHKCCITCGTTQRIKYPNRCRKCHELIPNNIERLCYCCETDRVEEKWALVVEELVELFR
jgi:hypothetical protein